MGMRLFRLILVLLLVLPHGWCCAAAAELLSVVRLSAVETKADSPNLLSHGTGTDRCCCCQRAPEQVPADDSSPLSSPLTPQPPGPCCCTTPPPSVVLNSALEFDPPPVVSGFEAPRSDTGYQPLCLIDRLRFTSESPPRHLRLCVWLC